MFYQIIAILILGLFYAFYFAKILIQKRQSIKTNQMGVGNKPKKVLWIERIMSVATVATCVVSVWSIFYVKHYLMTEIRIAGIMIGILAVFFFAFATITMKRIFRICRTSGSKAGVCRKLFRWYEAKTQYCLCDWT